MKYLILMYTNPEMRKVWESFTDEQRAEGLRAYAALNDDLKASGELVVSEALEAPSEARHLLPRDGDATVMDGPYAEVKEHLAGFYLVDCDTIERAAEIAARIPESSVGPVEILPIKQHPGLDS